MVCVQGGSQSGKKVAERMRQTVYGRGGGGVTYGASQIFTLNSNHQKKEKEKECRQIKGDDGMI